MKITAYQIASVSYVKLYMELNKDSERHYCKFRVAQAISSFFLHLYIHVVTTRNISD